MHSRLNNLRRALFKGVDIDKPLVVILNKVDLLDSNRLQGVPPEPDTVYFSTKTGQGLPAMMAVLKEKLGLDIHSDGLFSARRRHLSALQLASEHLQLAFQRLTEESAGELMAEELKCAQDALGEITGKLRSDELLGKIFSGFCIGK
jgi:tRNA modification GTPase